MTHNLTHTGKEAGGDSGADRTERIIFAEQKGLETAKYQWLLGFLSLGKDEVGSSNLPSSSKNSLKLVDFREFCFVLRTILEG